MARTGAEEVSGEDGERIAKTIQGIASLYGDAGDRWHTTRRMMIGDACTLYVTAGFKAPRC